MDPAAKNINQLLTIDSVKKVFGGVIALNDVSFFVERNTICGIIGPNGSGKTTLFNIITGSMRPSSGSVIFKDKDTSRLPIHIVASLGIVRTYQNTSLFEETTVVNNIKLATHLKTKSTTIDAILRSKTVLEDEKYIIKSVDEILNLTGLVNKKNELASNLSYGDQRKLEIAIALATDPEVLLVDEPAAGMNQSESDDLSGLLKKLRDENITILIVDHNMKLIMELCDKIVVLDHGEKLAEDTPKNIVTNSDVIKVYLGEDTEIA